MSPTIRLLQTVAFLSVLLSAWSPGAPPPGLTRFPKTLVCTATAHPSQSARELLRQGVEALEQNRFEQAVQALSAALKLDPGLELARYDLGVAYFSLGRFEESKQALEEVLRWSPGHPFARYFLGRIDLVQGNLDAAIHDFEPLSSRQPVADELYYLGVAYFRKSDTRQAIRVLERAVAWKTGDYRVHLLLSRAYQGTGRRSEAEREYSLSESLRASYRQKSREMTDCEGSLQKDDVESAAKRCNQLLDGDDPLKLTSLGTLLAEHQLYDRAAVPLEKASRLDPENYEAQFNLGLTCFQAKKYGDARTPLEAAVALRPESYDAVALLGTVLFALGDDFAAARQLRRAHQMNPTDEKIKTLLFEELRIIAQHFFAGGEYAKSVPFFKEALTLRPETPELRLQLAHAYKALGGRAPDGTEKNAPPTNH